MTVPSDVEEKERVGFVGLGQMGARMARRVQAAGFPIAAYDVLTERCVGLVKQGTRVCETLPELGEFADLIVVMVPSSQVDAVLLGPAGLCDAQHPGLVVIEGGNSDPLESRRRAEKLAGFGMEMLDVGFSGGPQNAETGDLAVMVGGSKRAFNAALPVLSQLGREIAHFGNSGAGHLAKALNHLVQGITAQAIGEALAIARASDIDLESWVEVASKGAAASWLMERTREMLRVEDFSVMDPWWQAHGARNQFTFSLEAAAGAELAVPLVALAHQIRTLSLNPARTEAMEYYVRLTWAFAHAAGNEKGTTSG